MQRKGDCDFFAWANNEMTTYETKIMERLKVLDDRRNADNDRLKKLIETKINDQYLILEKLIEKKYNDQYVKLEKLIEEKYKNKYIKLRRELEQCQSNGKIFWGMIVVVILLFVFYLSGYNESRGTYLMLN
jgi:lipopolysaccharide export LptBFGC system permease protein LptF